MVHQITWMDWIHLYITQHICFVVLLRTEDRPYYNISKFHQRKGVSWLHPYQWCNVIYSVVFKYMNNLCSLGVIKEYLDIPCAKRTLPLLVLGLYRACPQILHSVKFVFFRYYNMQNFGHMLIFLYLKPRNFIMDLTTYN